MRISSWKYLVEVNDSAVCGLQCFRANKHTHPRRNHLSKSIHCSQNRLTLNLTRRYEYNLVKMWKYVSHHGNAAWTFWMAQVCFTPRRIYRKKHSKDDTAVPDVCCPLLLAGQSQINVCEWIAYVLVRTEWLARVPYSSKFCRWKISHQAEIFIIWILHTSNCVCHNPWAVE